MTTSTRFVAGSEGTLGQLIEELILGALWLCRLGIIGTRIQVGPATLGTNARELHRTTAGKAIDVAPEI